MIIPEVDALSGNGTAPWIARANGGLAALNEAVSAKINGRILLWTAGFQPLQWYSALTEYSLASNLVGAMVFMGGLRAFPQIALYLPGLMPH